jgi:gliding motility-associated protein GldC
MNTSTIQIEVTRDDEKMIESIRWSAPDGGVDSYQAAKAAFLGLWDGEAKESLRIDLWTGKMMVDEMNDFLFQSIMGMSDTYARATRNMDLANEMKAFAKSFHKKATDALNADASS